MAGYSDGKSKRRERRYRLTPSRYDLLLKQQDGLCAICRIKPPTDVDHSSKTGHVRGLLCRPCNLGLGMFADDVERMRSAISYLDRPTQPLSKAMPEQRRDAGVPRPRGEGCQNSKINSEIVRSIRSEYAAGGVSYAILGDKYGLHPVHVGRVVRRVIWGHVQ